jgi:hypothetical protein
MPGPTLLKLRELTYRILGENADTISIDSTDSSYQDNPNYPLDRVDNAINEARYWLARMLDHGTMRSSDVVNAVSGETAFPTTFLCRLILRFRSSTSADYGPPLPMYTEEDLDTMQPGWRDEDSSSTPRAVVYRAKYDGTMTYELIPALSATVTSGLLRAWTRKPTALSTKTDTADELMIFPELQHTIIPYRAACILDFDNEVKAQRTMYLEAQTEKQLAHARRTLQTMAGKNVRLAR